MSKAGKPPLVPDRRAFLRQTGAVTAAVVAPGAAAAAAATSPQPERRALDLPLLQAVAEAILPEELGSEGVRDVLRDFVRWVDGFEPVAERPHPYLSSSEVRYGPADPAPMWAAQLEALDLLAGKRHGSGFVSLPVAARRELVSGDLVGHAADGAFPSPAYATHVAIGLLARFAARPATADLAYGARINAAACRDLASGAERPRPLAPTEA